MEKKILSCLFNSRGGYDKTTDILNESDFSDQGIILFELAKEFYEADTNASQIDTDIILSRIERKYPKHLDTFKHIINTLPEVSDINLIEELKAHKQHVVGMKLSSALLSSNHEEIRDLIERYTNLDTTQDTNKTEVYINTSFSDIIQSVQSDNLLRVYPLSFNEHLDGGVPLQTHIVVYAEPEVGKSLFNINAAAGFCKDGHKVLYVGNEDPKDQMLMRFATRMSGMNKYEIIKNPQEAQSRANDNGYGNLIFGSTETGTVGEIERLIEVYRPRVVIVDQIRHLNFPNITGEVEQITRAGKAMRALGKKYNTVQISVTQAANSASGKLILDMGDVYMSNTSLPGDADILLGIGANEQYKQQGRRMLSPCKNKINGNHESLAVAVDPTISKVISI
jgi:archaellum biogenesis ATPase FlaH